MKTTQIIICPNCDTTLTVGHLHWDALKCTGCKGYYSISEWITEQELEKQFPTKDEIQQEMELHNADEVGINNQWTFEDAEYHLLLSDEYNN